MATPSPNGCNGRTASGQFAVGNAGGPGNPHGRRVERLRAALLDAVTDDDVRAIVAKLVEMAKGGDLRAMKEVLDRTLGKSLAAVSLDVSAEGNQHAGSVQQRIRVVQDDDWYGNASRLSAQASASE